jgi:hypothetical protein
LRPQHIKRHDTAVQKIHVLTMKNGYKAACKILHDQGISRVLIDVEENTYDETAVLTNTTAMPIQRTY